ncbi:MAG: hypothetical protein HLUCCA11_01810 [Phormidesmis priestleyi Ana]|uniref:PRC-barrel domain n=1 Tax=Phormidesmis priestleyi Ana TaxID=1666911 RepID=A0A0P7ZPW4_9CYAN|nr:MAG: hypothetical protein HLUCCA11_01810 [Phormidesmis priestleyi Ana]
MDTAIIRQGELIGRELMAYETAEAVGSVEHLLVDIKRFSTGAAAPSHQIAGLVYKSVGLLARQQTISWAQVVKIGRDSIVIHTETTAAIASANESPLAAAQNMTSLEVWTDGGDHIGRIVDLCFDQATGEVQQYLFARLESATEAAAESTAESATESATEAAAESIAESTAESTAETPLEKTVTVYAIAPQAIISAGRKRMMIAEEDAQQAQPYAQPLTILAEPNRAPSRLPAWRPEQLPEMPTDFNELLHKGQSFAGRLTEQVKQRAKQFTDEQFAPQDAYQDNRQNSRQNSQQNWGEGDSLPDIAEQLQSKTEQVKQQMQERLQKAKEQAQAQIGNKRLEERFKKTSLGRSLGQTFGQTLDKFKQSKASEPTEPIDVDAFEVWEDD